MSRSGWIQGSKKDRYKQYGAWSTVSPETVWAAYPEVRSGAGVAVGDWDSDEVGLQTKGHQRRKNVVKANEVLHTGIRSQRSEPLSRLIGRHESRRTCGDYGRTAFAQRLKGR